MNTDLHLQVGLRQGGRFYYGWVMVVIGFFLMVSAYVCSISITSVFVIPVSEAFGVDRATFMFYQTILPITAAVSSGIFGKRMAKGNIRLIMAISSLCSIMGYVAFANADTIYQLYWASVLLGIGFANCTVLPTSIIINNWFGGKIKGTVMGITFVGSGVGGLMILPQLNAIIMQFGWRTGYYAVAAVYFVVLIVIVLTIRKTPEEKGFVRMGQAPGEQTIATAGGMMIKEALRKPMFWLALSTSTLTVLGSAAILLNSAPYFIDVGFSPEKAAQIASFNLGMLVVGKIFVGFLCDKFGTRFGTVSSAIIFGFGFVFLAFLPTNPEVLIWGCVLCYGIGGGGITVSPPLLVNALFGEKDYGSLIAATNIFVNIGGATGGLIAASVFDATGSYVPYWWVAAGFMVLVAVFRLICFQLRKKYDY